MAENLTTYTETDPNNRYTVTSTKIDIVALTRNEDAYVYKDFGAAYFSADMRYYVDICITGRPSGAGTTGVAFPFMLTNDIDDEKGLRDTGKNYLYIQCNAGDNSVASIILGERYSSTTYMTTYNGSYSTIYYLDIKRDEAVGTYGTWYCDVYTSSANRAAQTSAVANLSLTLHAKVDFQYLFACNSLNAGVTHSITGYFENLSAFGVIITVDPLTATFTLPAPSVPTYVAPSSLVGTFTLPAPTIVSSIKVLPDPLTATFVIPDVIAGVGVVAVDPLIASFTIPAVTVSLPCIVTVSPLTGTFYILDPYAVVSQKSILFGAYNFPCGKTMSYKIVDDTETTIQDWTTTGVVETVVDATADKSIYTVRTNKVNENFQGKIMWKSSDATPLTAVEIINIYSSYVDIIQNRLTAGRATNLDNLNATVSSRLPTASYTAPDNDGIGANSTAIASKPSLSQIEASNILAKEATLTTKASQASVDAIPTNPLLAPDYIAPDNVTITQIQTDIAALPPLSEIEASNILAKEATLTTKASQASVDAIPTNPLLASNYVAPDNANILTIKTMMDLIYKMERGKLVQTDNINGTKTYTYYEDDAELIKIIEFLVDSTGKIRYIGTE